MKKQYIIEFLGFVNIAIAMLKENMDMAIFTVLIIIWLEMPNSKN